MQDIKFISECESNLNFVINNRKKRHSFQKGKEIKRCLEDREGTADLKCVMCLDQLHKMNGNIMYTKQVQNKKEGN